MSVFYSSGLIITSNGMCQNIQVWTRWGFPATSSGSQTFCCITGKCLGMIHQLITWETPLPPSSKISLPLWHRMLECLQVLWLFCLYFQAPHWVGASSCSSLWGLHLAAVNCGWQGRRGVTPPLNDLIFGIASSVYTPRLSCTRCCNGCVCVSSKTILLLILSNGSYCKSYWVSMLPLT